MSGRIFVTGDTHGYIDITKLSSRNWPVGRTLDKEDYLIICGDFGLVWSGGTDEAYWLNWLESKPWTTLFVDGNHENHEMLDAMPAEEWHGGMVHMVRPTIIHLMRGQVFQLCGLRIFAMGGATSHDRQFRRANVDWWERELPSDDEFTQARANLERCGFTVDYVISHCGPVEVEQALGFVTHDYSADCLNAFFQELLDGPLTFGHWYLGHYHKDVDLNQIHVLYNRVVPLVPQEAATTDQEQSETAAVPAVLPQNFDQLPFGWQQLAVDFACQVEGFAQDFGFTVARMTWENKTGALALSVAVEGNLRPTVKQLLDAATVRAEVLSTYLCQSCGSDEDVFLHDDPDHDGCFLCEKCGRSA